MSPQQWEMLWLTVQFFVFYWGTKLFIYALAELYGWQHDRREKRRELEDRCRFDR